MTRSIAVVHSIPGRIRMRVSGLDRAPEEATVLADRLAGLDGMIETAVRPRTASVLCLYDPARLAEKTIVAVVGRVSGARSAARDDKPALPAEAREESPRGSRIGRALVGAFRRLDEDLLAATQGQLDLGTTAAFGFLAAGAAEILSTRRLPAPPWFNLAWWAFRTFTEFERGPNEESTPATVVPLHVVAGRRGGRARRVVAGRARKRARPSG